MTPRALMILHPGFEEIEAVAPIDLLARAGVQVIQASTDTGLLVTGRNGITLQATNLLSDLEDEVFDAVILPGGPGIIQLRGDIRIIKCLRRHHKNERLVAAICAAPLLLLDAGLHQDIAYTAHPSTSDELSTARDESVVIDGHFITSQGAGTATEFALAVVSALCGEDCAHKIATSICWSHPTIQSPHIKDT